MDGFVLILAIIVFSVFRNFISETKKRDRDLPGSFDTSAEHKEAQERALDALRQWEAKQRSIAVRVTRRGPGGNRCGSDGRGNIGRTFACRRRSVRSCLRRRAGRDRSNWICPGKPSRRGEKRTTRSGNCCREGRSVPRGRLRSSSPRADCRSRSRRRRRPGHGIDPRCSGHGSRVRSVVVPKRRNLLRPRASKRRDPDQSAPAGLARLNVLSPVARGFLYAELLGKPVAFRGSDEDDRY